MNITQKQTLAMALPIVLIAAMAWAGNADHAEAEREHLRYCERVVQFEAQAARGIPIEQRQGHRDHKGIAAEHCPGMRPAP
ncbi:hypothetical protein HZU72_17565 [Halomonas sp. QX-2]|uniref:Secreted protein n=1 Tax=Vreelandella sedimenti TaxID=2729618 RepID=A0A7Z0N9P5_9GAMM|nr:hypothetical protein [Halomonas sedimenti]NYT74222.1 hypothetical protein [Halomonas sedimenti]